MVKRKSNRARGKISLSRYFQKLEKGDRVSIAKEQSMASSFPERFQGRIGIIEGKRGKAYLVSINDQDKRKTFLIEPIHLKKIKVLN